MVGIVTAARSMPADAVPPSRIAQWLEAVRDPEVPVLSVMDLGIVRDIGWDGDTCVVTVTPTYSGCPAMGEIRMDIERVLHGKGIASVKVRTRLAPAWTTDWMSESGRRALNAYGIAPPAERAIDVSGIQRRAAPVVACPRCGSRDTRLLSGFGATACKALYRCAACREPFDYFKPH
jgi:ring-1,2-phenylacetyl-CoA epoxidase subunit PaaD